MKSLAKAFVDLVMEKIDALAAADKADGFDTSRLYSTRIDNAEPWEWHKDAGAWGTEEDDGEDFTVTFSDDSKARWINTERAWEEVREQS